MRPVATDWYVYILSNRTHRLYVGSTDDLIRRYREHVERRKPKAFTARYTYNRLVYYEVSPSKAHALKRERQIKAWTRAKKVALIQGMNPNWYDLSRKWHRFLRAD
jgi:putative endonuclease